MAATLGPNDNCKLWPAWQVQCQCNVWCHSDPDWQLPDWPQTGSCHTGPCRGSESSVSMCNCQNGHNRQLPVWGQSGQNLLCTFIAMAIDGHFANSLRYLLRFCNSSWYLLRFMAILQQFQVFLMILLFTAFSLVTWGLIADRKNYFSPCFKHPPHSRTGRKEIFFQYFLMCRIIRSKQNQ